MGAKCAVLLLVLLPLSSNGAPCAVYVCPGMNKTLLQEIGAGIGIQFEFVDSCKDSGTRDACVVVTYDDVSWEATQRRACTDTNAVHYNAKDSVTGMVTDMALLFAPIPPLSSVCGAFVVDFPLLSWCYYASVDMDGCRNLQRIPVVLFDADVAVSTSVDVPVTTSALVLLAAFIPLLLTGMLAQKSVDEPAVVETETT